MKKSNPKRSKSERERTRFDIEDTERVVRPFSNTGEALSNAIYAEFVVFHTTAAQQAEFLANAVFTNFTGVDYDPDNVFAMFSQSFINAARLQVRGIDLSCSYGRNVGDGRLPLLGRSEEHTSDLQSLMRIS